MKGITFSIDALIAVMIAIIGIAAVIGITNTGRTEATEMGPLQATGQDVLTVLDKNGTFMEMFNQNDAQAASAAAASLTRLLPPQLTAKLNITICTFTNPGFNCNRNIVVQTNSSEMPFKSVARRVFADARNGKFGVAFLEVGYGGFGTGTLKYNGEGCNASSQCYSGFCGANYPANAGYCCAGGSAYCCAANADCGGSYPVCTPNSNCSGVTSITVSPGSVTLGLFGTQQFSATCDYAGSLGPCSPSWGADAAVGSVNASGFFTAGAFAGNGTVNASIGSVVGSAAVTVIGTLANGVNCTNSSQCTSGFCGANYPANVSYCCTSGSPYCCAADADCGGNYTACGGGKNCTAITTVFVTPDPALVNVSTSQQFNASCYSGASGVSCIPAPSWSMSGGIGVVNGSGYFTAGSSLKNGTVNATVGSVMGYASVRVVYGNGVECSSNSSCASGYCGPNRVGNKDYCCAVSPSMWCCTKQAECGGAYPTCGLTPDYNCR